MVQTINLNISFELPLLFKLWKMAQELDFAPVPLQKIGLGIIKGLAILIPIRLDSGFKQFWFFEGQGKKMSHDYFIY